MAPGADAAAGGGRGRLLLALGIAAALAGVVLVAGVALAVARRDGGRAAPSSLSTTSPTPGSGSAVPPVPPTSALPPARGPFAPGRAPIRGFDEVRVVAISRSGRRTVLCVLAARTEAQRERGLMEVLDARLGGYDGMVFVFDDDQPASGGFWMRNTRLPLSIVWFDASGRRVGGTDMAPCPDGSPCPTYPAGKPFRSALEVPVDNPRHGVVGGLARIDVGGGCDPAG
ncbi:MAG: DUF192 domain-containing protein [Actinobacteria bacterium]|nr:DUF192 domain-containing protein [Actinomycetota bacterium]